MWPERSNKLSASLFDLANFVACKFDESRQGSVKFDLKFTLKKRWQISKFAPSQIWLQISQILKILAQIYPPDLLYFKPRSVKIYVNFNQKRANDHFASIYIN